MDINTLDRLAKENKVMESHWLPHEQVYFLASRTLYKDYDKGTITIDRARKEKSIITKTYMDQKEKFEFFKSMCSIEISLKKLKEQGFNSIIEWEVLEEIDRWTKAQKK